MIKYLHKYANPNIFLKIIKPFRYISLYLSIFLIACGLIMSLFFSPPDYQQSETVRIMYIHVPSAWISLLAYVAIFFLSLFYIIWKFPLFILIAKELPVIGVTFTLITLITGSLWGKPTWGTYWVWDARLTSFLILLFIYLGLIFLEKSFKFSNQGNNSFAYLAIIGGINIPIIKFSVDWWNTLHQPASVVRIGGPTISSDILIPLLVMSFGLMCLFVYLTLTNVISAINEKKFIAMATRK